MGVLALMLENFGRAMGRGSLGEGGFGFVKFLGKNLEVVIKVTVINCRKIQNDLDLP